MVAVLGQHLVHAHGLSALDCFRLLAIPRDQVTGEPDELKG
jgi:hypothetical protein